MNYPGDRVRLRASATYGDSARSRRVRSALLESSLFDGVTPCVYDEAASRPLDFDVQTKEIIAPHRTTGRHKP